MPYFILKSSQRSHIFQRFGSVAALTISWKTIKIKCWKNKRFLLSKTNKNRKINYVHNYKFSQKPNIIQVSFVIFLLIFHHPTPFFFSEQFFSIHLSIGVYVCLCCVWCRCRHLGGEVRGVEGED